MKLFFSLCFLILFFTQNAKAEILQNTSFTKAKEYSSEPYVLLDAIEFSVFDMSKLNLFVNSEEIDLTPNPVAPVVIPHSTTPNVELPVSRAETKAEKEIKSLFQELPKLFYQNLKAHILKEKLPVHLFSSSAPEFSKPIQFYIKLKKIQLTDPVQDKKGNTFQPVAIKIYGQLKDKEKDLVLLRFYDVESTQFQPGTGEARLAFDAMSSKMMKDLVLFMKTKY